MIKFLFVRFFPAIFAVALLTAPGHSQPELLWMRTYGGGESEGCWSHIQLDDRGFLFAGEISHPQDGDTDAFLLRADADGDEVWRFETGGERRDTFTDVSPADGGGFVAAGFLVPEGELWSDGCLVKVNADGEQVWSHSFGGEHFDEFYSLVPVEDGGFTAAGYTWSFGAGEKDFYLVEVNGDGEQVWARTYGGGSFDYGRTHTRTSDGGFALGGYTVSFGHGQKDIWLVKTDPQGELEWSHAYGGEEMDDCYALVQTGDDGFALAGYTTSLGAGGLDFYLVRTDAEGDQLWQHAFGGEDDEICYALRETRDGGFILAGSTQSFGEGQSDYYLVRVDRQGRELWSSTYGGRFADDCLSLIAAPFGFSLAGFSSSFGEQVDIWQVAVGEDPVIRFAIPLHRGWSMISSPVPPVDPSMDSIWEAVVRRGNLLLVKDHFGRFYVPGGGFDHLEWDVRYGYQAKLEAPDTLELMNQPVPPDTPIPLPEGWSIAAYFPPHPMAAQAAFAGIVDVLILAKDGEGRFYTPEFDFSNMSRLRRGQGYQVRVSEDTDLVWNVPDEFAGTGDFHPLPEVETTADGNRDFIPPPPTGRDMSLLVTRSSFAGETVELGVFAAGGLCVGSAVLKGPPPWGMAVRGDDPSTRVVDGAREGERLTFKFHAQEREFEIEPIWVEGDGSYISDCLAVADFEGVKTSFAGRISLEAHPNPFNRAVRLDFDLDRAAAVSLRIYDINGREIAVPTAGRFEPGGHSLLWDTGRLPSGYYLAQLEVGKQRKSVKLVLLK